MLTKEKISEINETRLAQIESALAEKCRAIIRLAAAENFLLIVTQGFRSIAEQNQLYAIGRRGIKGERKVTNAKGGQSNHNFKKAVDFAFVVGGEISWDEKHYWKFFDLKRLERFQVLFIFGNIFPFSRSLKLI